MDFYITTIDLFDEDSTNGVHFDLADYADYDDFMEAVKAAHSDESDPEFVVSDWSDTPDTLISQSPTIHVSINSKHYTP